MFFLGILVPFSGIVCVHVYHQQPERADHAGQTCGEYWPGGNAVHTIEPVRYLEICTMGRVPARITLLQRLQRQSHPGRDLTLAGL